MINMLKKWIFNISIDKISREEAESTIRELMKTYKEKIDFPK